MAGHFLGRLGCSVAAGGDDWYCKDVQESNQHQGNSEARSCASANSQQSEGDTLKLRR
jgi:hypothetical protein